MPAPRARHSGRHRRLPKAIDRELWDSIIAAAGVERRYHLTGPRDEAIIALFLGSSLRCAELCRLDLEDVPAGADSIQLIGKGDKERVVAVACWVHPFVDAYRRQRPQVEGERGGPLFLSRKLALGGRLDTSAVRRLVGRVEAHLQANGISPHAFRHSHLTQFVDKAIEDGLNLFDVADQSGHEDLETLRIYYKGNIRKRKKVVDRI